MVAHTFKPHLRGRDRQISLHSKFQASRGYIVKPFLKQNKTKTSMRSVYKANTGAGVCVKVGSVRVVCMKPRVLSLSPHRLLAVAHT